MNWYELAGSDEVRENLLKLLSSTYGFMHISWVRSYEYSDRVRVENLPSNGFEIAEALWGEYSEELF